MASAGVPAILDQVALAGEAGLPLPSCSPDYHELEKLRDRGFPLELDGNVARFRDDGDSLVPALIRLEAKTECFEPAVHAFLELGSTSEYAVSLARRSAPEGTLVIAETQTSGRGRRGRRWSTAPGAGLCFSFVARPGRPIEEWPLLGLVCASALAASLAQARDEVAGGTGALPELKWPNDILLCGRKVAGILIEMLTDDSGNRAAVIGVGLNIRAGWLPPELVATATTLETEWKCRVPRRSTLTGFLAEFQRQYAKFQLGECATLLELWKQFCPMWLDTPVWVSDENGRWPAITAGLDAYGALRVRTVDGASKTLLAADVSVRRA